MSKPINATHILITGPLLVYLGLAQTKPAWVYNLLLALGIILALYFLYLIISTKLSQYHVWLTVHLVLFIPLLIVLGIKKDATPPIILSLLLAIGCAAIGYHLIRLFQPHKISEPQDES